MKEDVEFKFCFTLDTEPDNLWSDPPRISFDHFSRLLGFHQELVARGARPTYLTTSEVAEDAGASRILGKILDTGSAEIGAHFHTWTRSWPFDVPDLGNPPIHACAHQLGQELEERMLRYTRESIERFFRVRLVSYRGGRWSLNEHSLKSLRNNGFRVDSTVTPGLTWESAGNHLCSGPDFRHLPNHPFFFQGESFQPSRHGEILELPVGVGFIPDRPTALRRDLRAKLSRRVRGLFGIPNGCLWLRPTLMSRNEMRACLESLWKGNVKVWVAMIHSSELVPCKYFESEEDVDKFRKRCLALVEDAVAMGAHGATLREVLEHYERQPQVPGSDFVRHQRRDGDSLHSQDDERAY